MENENITTKQSLTLTERKTLSLDNVKKIEIHHGDMEAQQFQIGDFVYIDEDGNMESVGTS